MNVALMRGCPRALTMSAFDERLGFTCQEARDGQAAYTADAGPAWHNPTGRLHGGFLASLCDAAMGAAFMSSLDTGESGTNLDLDIRFLRRAKDGPLTARARTVKRGATISVLACDVEDGEGRLVAVAHSQFLRLKA